MNPTKVLTHLIRAGRNALNLENVLAQLGYKETPYFNLYGEIADAIYSMIGEDADTFDQSVTHAVLNDPITPDEIAAEQLAPFINNGYYTDMQINKTAREIITEAANASSLDFETMVRLILSEWAMRQVSRQQLQS